MVGLVDIAPAAKTVHGVKVTGVSARGIANILQRFETVRALIAGRSISAEELFSIAPDAVAAIIAAGTGSPGDTAQELLADSLPLEIQMDLLEAILEVTFPGGFGPFAARLAGLASSVATAQPEPVSEASTKAQASTSASASPSYAKGATRRI